MLDPSIGRWFGEDPIDFGAGDASLYRYVGNNPTNATDPSGHLAVPVPPRYDVPEQNLIDPDALLNGRYPSQLGVIQALADPSHQNMMSASDIQGMIALYHAVRVTSPVDRQDGPTSDLLIRIERILAFGQPQPYVQFLVALASRIPNNNGLAQGGLSIAAQGAAASHIGPRQYQVKAVSEIIRRLDDDDYTVRESARRELEKPEFRRVLLEFLQGDDYDLDGKFLSVEAKRSIVEVIEKVQGPQWRPGGIPATGSSVAQLQPAGIAIRDFYRAALPIAELNDRGVVSPAWALLVSRDTRSRILLKESGGLAEVTRFLDLIENDGLDEIRRLAR